MQLSPLFKRALGTASVGLSLLATTPSEGAIVGLWDFEGTVNDVSGNGNHGTAGGGVPNFINNAPVGGGTSSLSFAGGLHVIVANEQNFDFGNNMTVSTWVKGGLPGTWDPFISKNGEPNGWQLRRNSNSNQIDFTTRRSPNNANTDFPSTNNAAGSIIATDPGNWHHIVGTFDGVTKRIYIDGVLNNSVNVPAGAIIDSPASVIFGGRQNPGPGVGNTSFEGQLDNVAIYNNALNAIEISHLAAGGSAIDLQKTITWDFGDTPNLQGWTVLSGGAFFRPDEGGGITAANSGGGFAHDPAHTNFLVESPNFRLALGTDNAIVVQADFRGGKGDQSGNIGNYDTPLDVINYNGGGTNTVGVKAIGILDIASGEYIGFLLDPGDADGGGTIASLTAAQLKAMGASPFNEYRLHFFDTDQGSWGWTQLNSVVLAQGSIPEPATLSLIGLAGLGLMRRRRRLA